MTPIEARKREDTKGGVNLFDLLGFGCLCCLAALAVFLGRHSFAPLATPSMQVIHLDLPSLPSYALRSALRMCAALIIATGFAIAYAAAAAKSRLLPKLLLSLLDYLRCVPALGFLAFTALFFTRLIPGRDLGAELAIVATVCASLTWTMTSAFYKAITHVPVELDEVARSIGLCAWRKFWRLEMPFAIPSLVREITLASSGAWFVLIYSEVINVGNTQVVMPGIGSYVAFAVQLRDPQAVVYAIFTAIIVILLFEGVLIRPLVSWSARFANETPIHTTEAIPWGVRFLRKASLFRSILNYFSIQVRRIGGLQLGSLPQQQQPTASKVTQASSLLAFTIALLAVLFSTFWVSSGLGGASQPFNEIFRVITLSLITLLRVSAMIIAASVFWLPAGIWIGLRRRGANSSLSTLQFLIIFPANLLFPIFAYFAAKYRLNSDLWLTPLVVFGAQWSILYSIVNAVRRIPQELLEAATNLRVNGKLWLVRVILPAILPAYVSGAWAASIIAWNTAIASELVYWGDDKIVAHGLGAYIAQAVFSGALGHASLGIAVMSLVILLLNFLLWRPLYQWSERRFTFSRRA